MGPDDDWRLFRDRAGRQGRRLFDNLSPEHVELERTRVLMGEGGVTHLHYRIRR